MKDLLATLQEEFWDQLEETSDSVPRQYEFPSIPNMINVAIGMRRSGKSYFMYQKIRELLSQKIEKEQILYINFEDDRLLPMSQNELARIIEAFYSIYPINHKRNCYLFLDEIQNIDDWALVVRRIFETKNVHLYLSGSSAKLLSKEIATSLRGRSITTEIWPYSFEEYLIAHKTTLPKPPLGKKNIDIYHEKFCDYLLRGGFPAIQHVNETDRRRILQGYVNSVIFRDIVERHHVTNITLLKYLIKSLIGNVASPFVVNKFFKDVKSQGIKVGKDTIYQYLDYLEDAYLIFPVGLFTKSARKMQVNPKKIYAIDPGLVVASTLNPNWGNLFENQVFLDLKRKGHEIFYYITEEGYEIDFVTQSIEGEHKLIQVVWNQDSPNTMAREERALNAAKNELGIEGRIISVESYICEMFDR